MANRVATTSLSNWNFNTQHVQQNLSGGDFAGSHTCVMCATVPRLSDLMGAGDNTDSTGLVGSGTISQGNAGQGKEFAIPIGVVDSLALAQDRQIAQVFEVGSKRSYILSARTIGTIQISRVFYKGPSLMRMLYAYYPASKLSGGNSNILRDLQNNQATSLGEEPVAGRQEFMSELPSIKNTPGFDNFVINLDSDLFSQPMGIVLYFKDNKSSDIGAVFLEECYVQNHGMQIAANSVLIAEQTSLRFERLVPMKVNVVQNGGGGGVPAGGLSTGNASASVSNVLSQVQGAVAGLSGITF